MDYTLLLIGAATVVVILLIISLILGISNSSKIHFGPKSHFLLEISTCSFDSLLKAPPCPL